jgi:tetratricopeptide (TPR) repeat protein
LIYKKKPLNKSIIAAFLKKGHVIDERQGPVQITGLYCACQYGQLEAAQILLEFKADPCAKHKIKTLLDGYIIATPLSVAANKGFTPLVLELLKYPIQSAGLKEQPIPSAEIYRAIRDCPHPETQKVLRQAFCQTLNREAIEAHRAGHFESAEQLYQRAIGAAVSDEEIHFLYYNLGVSLLAMNQLAGARNTFEHCLALRENLANGPRKDEMLPLLVKVKEKLAAVKECVKKAAMIKP